MKRHSTATAGTADLRRRAEQRLRQHQPVKGGPGTSHTDTLRILQELQIHQIELELQNEELKQTKAEVDAGLEKFTDLYDFAPVGYFTFAADGTIQLVNLTGASLVGIERSRLVGRAFGLFLAIGHRAGFAAFLQQVFAGENRRSGEFELAGQGPAPRIVNISAQRLPNGRECRAAVMDVTAHKRAEDKVRVSEIRYRRLFEASHDGVLLLDPTTGKISEANPFITKLLGYPHDQLIGKELFEIGLLQDEAASREMFQKLKQSHEVRYEDLPLRTHRGRRQEVEVVANLYLENGRPVIQCNIRDITLRRQAEEAQRRLDVVTASNRKLELEIVRRQAVEAALKQSEHDTRQLLVHAHRLQKKLRHFSHQILQVQEDQRKEISRELHDKVCQLLVGINVQLAVFARAAATAPWNIRQTIAPLRRLVAKSVQAVHRFARELRPAVLDDLGLIPALRAYLDDFPKRKGRKIHFAAFAGVEALDTDKRTVLYRIVQEALTNVDKHARARVVRVAIYKAQGGVCLEVSDDGKAFDVSRLASGQWGKRLGLLGMRERVEMVGGRFSVESKRGTGTTIRAEMPLRKIKLRK